YSGYAVWGIYVVFVRTVDSRPIRPNHDANSANHPVEARAIHPALSGRCRGVRISHRRGTMETFFLVCAALGGTVLILQSVAGMLGLGHHDTDHSFGEVGDHDGNWFLGALSVRTVAAALTFFGLGGLTAAYYGASEPATLGVAVGSGIAAFYAVALLMQ